jgi:hypothetical protein
MPFFRTDVRSSHNRQVKRPTYAKTDRLLLVLLARAVRTWKQALFIVQPETLLRWHRQGFRLFRKYKSRAGSPQPKISEATVTLIKDMARDNRLWGAERIRQKRGFHALCLPRRFFATQLVPMMLETREHAISVRTNKKIPIFSVKTYFILRACNSILILAMHF